ncbi:MAG: hypothetical protein ACI8PB_001015 [Desulforhopalus sp.]|jgi:hypothetical protein
MLVLYSKNMSNYSAAPQLCTIRLSCIQGHRSLALIYNSTRLHTFGALLNSYIPKFTYFLSLNLNSYKCDKNL